MLLLIPQNCSCLIDQQDSFLSEIIDIRIQGNLFIEDKFSFYLKIRNLKIDQYGILSIGKFMPIYNNLIVMEHVGHDDCSNEFSIEGQLEIYSMPYQVYPLYESAFKGENYLQTASNPSKINSNDDIYIVGSYQNYSQEKVKVKSIQNGKITVELPLTNDYIKHLNFKNSKTDAFIFSSVRQHSGVQIINWCMEINVERFVGVAFINPQKLILRGGDIENCLFFNSLKGNMNKQNKKVQIYGSARKNIFFRMKDYFLEISRNSNKNSFIDISYSILNCQGDLIDSQVHFCDMEIMSSSEKHSLNFDSTQSYNSRYLFQKIQNNYEVNLLNNSLFYKMNTFYLNQLNSLLIQNSYIISSTFSSSNNQNLNHLSLIESVFLGEQIKQSLFTFCTDFEQQQQQPKVLLQLYNNSFIGFTKSIFSTCLSQKRNSQQFAQKNEEIQFDIKWQDNLYDIQDSIFDLDGIKITLLKDNKILHAFQFQNIIHHNITSQICHIPLVKSSLLTLIESENFPSYYRLNRYFDSLEDEQKQSYRNIDYSNSYEYVGYDYPKQIFYSNYDQVIQIVTNQAHIINLQNLKKSEFNSTMEIENNDFNQEQQFLIDLFETSPSIILAPSDSQNKKIIFTFSHQSMSKIAIKKYHSNKSIILDHQNNHSYIFSSQEDSYKKFNKTSQLPTDQLIIQYERKQNELSITWFNLPTEGITLLLKIQNCKEKEILDLINNRCTTEINQYVKKHPFSIDYQCNLGFFQDQTDKQICNKCKLYCKVCNKDHCYACIEGYFLSYNQCIKECPTGFYQNNETCFSCIEGCAKCNNLPPICDNCIQPSRNFLCLPCQQGKILKDNRCINCTQPHCVSCNNYGLYNCEKCEQGYEKVNGICQMIYVSQSCQIGYFQKNHECFKCQEQCLTCISDSDNSCLQCSPSSKSIHNNQEGGVCMNCDKGYYGEGNKCLKCNESCGEISNCFGPSNKQCFQE